jgi:Putative DNA-binding domain
MTTRWTRLHAALGDTPGPLSFEQVKRAVDAELPETEDLDWKKGLPGANLDEFAKDVAALANAAGGLLVYGVAEKRGVGTAESLSLFDLTETDVRRLRSTVFNRIQPAVTGVDFLELKSSEEPGSVLVVSVPASEDAPHQIGSGNQTGVPFRVGTDTHWMNERSIERAYTERFQRRTNEANSLADDIHQSAELIDLDEFPWLVAVAHPFRPRTGVTPPLSGEDVKHLLEATLIASAIIAPDQNRDHVIRELNSAALNPRVGLRRWIVQTANHTNNGDDRSNYVLLEVRHDGSVLFAVALGRWLTQVVDKYNVPCSTVEGFSADLVALIDTTGREVIGGGPYSYRVELLRSDERAFAAVDNQYVGGMTLSVFEQPPWSRSVRQFRPATGQILTPAGIEDQLDLSRTIALDVLNQFGISTLRRLPVP